MNASPDAASVAIFSDDQVLLIKRALPPYAGYWTLPGGRREPDETIENCALREILEELGVQLGAIVLVDQTQVSSTFWLQVFAAHMPTAQLTPNAEIADWQWARLSEIESLHTTPDLLDILKLSEACLNKS